MVSIDGGRGEKKQRKPKDFGYTYVPGTPFPAPLETPPFTLKEIRDAIPPHCFKRSALKYFRYLALDVLTCLSLFYASTFIGYFPVYISALMWPVYWFVQGVYMSGLWVIAHECGHQAFSDHKIINDTVGLLLHSFLLVPFHNWKITHHRHHLHSGSIENDEPFVPNTRGELERFSGRYINYKNFWAIDSTPLHNIVSLVIGLAIGFFPLYLIWNITGPKKYDGKNANHFNPTSVLFSPKQYNEVVLSNIGVFSVVFGFILVHVNYGFTPILFHYLIPYVLTNFNVGLITLLHHTDTFVPHYRDEEWSWIRGALSTVDRSYGKWLDGAFHHINDTHICHHLFSSMPFYHAQEATSALRKVLGPYYLNDPTPIPTALWRAFNNCKFVEDNDSIAFYKKTLK